MGFGDLINKGKEALAGEDGKIDYAEYKKDASEVYDEYKKKDSVQDAAKKAYEVFGKKDDSDKDADKKDEKKDDK